MLIQHQRSSAVVSFKSLSHMYVLCKLENLESLQSK